MFEVEEGEIERLSFDYDMATEEIIKYAEILGNCELIRDEDTYLRALEETISMCSNFAQRKGALRRTLTVMNLADTDEEIREAIKNMLELYKQSRKGRGSK